MEIRLLGNLLEDFEIILPMAISGPQWHICLYILNTGNTVEH